VRPISDARSRRVRKARTNETGGRRPNESGVVVVLLALLLPLFLLVGVIAVDVGDWYVHTKRLQTLIDARASAVLVE
jgi:Flp pilus assembly protein TadG